MKLLKFASYDEYRATQVAANIQKFSNVFVEDDELRRIAGDFSARAPGGRFGLCHGVRNGYEVRVLRKFMPKMDVLGTDISSTAASVPHSIVWDMHEIKAEWIERVDFLYSNSWDHTYDPQLLFSRWSQCLSAIGRMYLPYTEEHSEAAVTDDSKYDVFGCSLDELLTILQKTLVVEDVIELQPHVAWSRALRRRLFYLRTGKLGKLFSSPVKSRRTLLLVLKRRPLG